jgi:hypothetical protein
MKNYIIVFLVVCLLVSFSFMYRMGKKNYIIKFSRFYQYREQSMSREF